MESEADLRPEKSSTENANHQKTFQVPKMQESSPIYIYKLYGYGLWIQENPPPQKIAF